MNLNFLAHQRQIIEEHSPDELSRTLMQKHNWTQDDEHIVFLPFGLLCLASLIAIYQDIGVTDALHKYEMYTQAKPFNPNNVSAWIAKLLHAWTTYRNSITNPEHMAAVETLQQIIKCDEPEWKAWAFQYSLRVGDSAYTVSDLLDAVQRHDKMQMHSKQKNPLALVGNPHGAKKGNKPQAKVRICANTGCKNPTPSRRLNFCNTCFRDTKKKAAVLETVPPAVRDTNEQKRRDKLKQKFAQLKRKASDMTQEALLTEVDKIFVEGDEGDDSTQRKKKKSKKGNKSQGVALAEANVFNPSDVSEMPKTPCMAKPPLKHTTALKTAGKAKKRISSVTTPKASSDDEQALLVIPDPLAGCTVHTFAGAKFPKLGM